jgi:HAD superfamily hydrolase (TIGR01490 family)
MVILNKKQKKVAIFDVDGTIFRSSLLIKLVEAFIEEEIFPTSAKKGYDREYKSWLERKGTYDEYIEAIIRVFIEHIRGVSYNDFLEVSKKIVEKHKDETYVYTRTLVKKLRKQGYFLLAISQSPKGILDTFCKHLGFDKVYGRFYETDAEDNFTGQVAELHLIANKANIVKRAVERENLLLKGSIGVGDTEGDIPMLELVENPICFNPNQKLYRFAKLNKWKVVVERKDVVYEIAG